MTLTERFTYAVLGIVIGIIIILLNRKKAPDWKKPIELYYKDNILTIRTLDHNITEYTHHINEPVPYAWKKRLNKHKFITDPLTIKQLDKYYHLKREGGGWVKALYHT